MLGSWVLGISALLLSLALFMESAHRVIIVGFGYEVLRHNRNHLHDLVHGSKFHDILKLIEHVMRHELFFGHFFSNMIVVHWELSVRFDSEDSFG